MHNYRPVIYIFIHKVGNLFFSTYYVLSMMLRSKDTVENKIDTSMILTLTEFMVLEHIMNKCSFYIDF